MRKRLYIWAIVPLLFVFFADASFAQDQVLTKPEILEPIKMGVSQPVRDLPIITQKEMNTWKDGIIPLQTPSERYKVDVGRDGSLQDYPGPYGTTDITKNFDGVGALGYAPPDPSGDVGPNHYVQMVNVRSQIWDKNGNSLAGPFNNINFWAGLPGPWSGTNDGDPIVLYDDLADRWMVSQFALPNYPFGPFYVLIAISQTPDPTGAYWQYAYSFPNMPDYPKFGVWPDGYYMSANVFASGSGSYLGTYAAVFNRSAMLVGGAATGLYFTLPNTTWSLLPSDCDGVAPPAGAPNYFLASYGPYLAGNANLDIYQFHVDWVTPANSTWTGPLLLATPAFTWVSGIPQLGTGTLLDDLSDRPMNRLQYRNFGDHQSMVVCQTVNAGGGRAGMRWWELRKIGGNWFINQESTYAPADGLYRWMGSIAIDASGNIALGYSVSSGGMWPAIRYTGRLAADPPGTMTIAENTIQTSGGAQTGLERWGDYTQMTVDPTVTNTFWYTNQYQPTTGSFNWKTRIAAFNFGGAAPYITVILPNSSSVWHVKSFEDITWDDNIAGDVKILLYYNGVKVKTISSGTPSDGLFTWHIPRAFVPGDLKQYKVKIMSVDDHTVKDISEKFRIDPALAGDIAQNYPNPFNPSTVIKYSIPFQGKVNIIVYDALGQVVRQLVDAVQDAGEYNVVFDATSLASGMYFYTVEVISPDGQNDIREVKKMLFLK